MAPSDDDAANDDAADVAIVELAPIPDVAADGVHAGGQHGVDADATDEKAEHPEGSGAKSTMVGAAVDDAAATDGALTGALVPPHDAAASPDKEKAEESAAAATDSTDVAKNTGALQGDAAAATDVTAENTPKGSGTKSNTDGALVPPPHNAAASPDKEKAEDPEGSGAKSTMVGAAVDDAAAKDGALTGALVPPHDAAASPDKEKAEESAAAATAGTDVAKDAGALQRDAAAATDVTAENTPKGSGTKSNTDGALVPPPHDAAASPDKEKAEESAAAATDSTDVAKDAGALPPPHDAVASPDDEAEESVPSARTPRTRYSDSSDDSIYNVIDNRGIPTAINAIQDQILSPMGSPSKKQTCIVKAKSIPVHPVVLGLMLPRLPDGRIVCINTNHNDPKANLIGEITNRLLGNPTNACIENHKNGDITADQLIAHAFIGEKDALTTEVSVQQVNTK